MKSVIIQLKESELVQLRWGGVSSRTVCSRSAETALKPVNCAARCRWSAYAPKSAVPLWHGQWQSSSSRRSMTDFWSRLIRPELLHPGWGEGLSCQPITTCQRIRWRQRFHVRCCSICFVQCGFPPKNISRLSQTSTCKSSVSSGWEQLNIVQTSQPGH